MSILLLAFLGGLLTILSPCILPVIPLVFARTGRGFRREILPMLGGLAVAFTGAALLATATARWLVFALGAAMFLALISSLGARILARLTRAGAADVIVRRTLGLATLATVIAIFFGWDRALFAKGGFVKTASAEERLVSRLAPSALPAPPAGMSLDAFAAQETAREAAIALPVADGTLPSLDGGTEWINSRPLTPDALRGKVVLVDFWTFECYNCLNALPHVKELYAKYKDRGFVVGGVHTPEFARERIPENVRREVKKLGIEYPVVIDNDNRMWNAFHSQYWPAAYYADATGKMRFYHLGEGRYEEQDKVVARLLAERDASTSGGGR